MKPELPGPGVWAIDPGHAEVAFVGRHFGLTKVRGRFTGVAGDRHHRASHRTCPTCRSTIDMASVSVGQTRPATTTCGRPTSSTSADHPQATFRSTGVARPAPTATMTRRADDQGRHPPGDPRRRATSATPRDPWGDDRAVFSAAGDDQPRGLGTDLEHGLEAGGLLVSKEIRLEIEVELVRAVEGA